MRGEVLSLGVTASGVFNSVAASCISTSQFFYCVAFVFCGRKDGLWSQPLRESCEGLVSPGCSGQPGLGERLDSIPLGERVTFQ